tara:strand:- start:265 stop:726 length:462 start_codon:yes stop_codon:yes gene_type:complete
LTNFFESKEYLTYKKLRKHISILNTDKNINLFLDWRYKAMELACSDFDEIGFRDDDFSWDKGWEDDMGEQMIVTYSRKFKKDVYIGKETGSVVLKDTSGKYHTFKMCELEILKKCNDLDSEKLIAAKCIFEGELNEEGSGHSKRNKNLAKQAR